MDKAAYIHFVSMLCAEKLKIQEILGIHQHKNLTISWLIMASQDWFDAFKVAFEEFKGLEKFGEDIYITVDESTISWELRATIRSH